MKLISGLLEFGETRKSISGSVIGEILEELNGFILEKWELPRLEINNKTNCFEPTGESYFRYGATKYKNGGSSSHFFEFFAQSEIFALTN